MRELNEQHLCWQLSRGLCKLGYAALPHCNCRGDILFWTTNSDLYSEYSFDWFGDCVSNRIRVPFFEGAIVAMGDKADFVAKYVT